jgi:6-phosphofructokinase 1
MDRVLASRLGVAAVEVLRNGHRNEMAGLIHNSIVYTSFERSVKHNIDLNTDLLKVVEMLSL